MISEPSNPSAPPTARGGTGLLDRMGLPRPLLWGFIGLTLFMIGDGVETNILTPYLTGEHGFSIPLAGTLITIYGVAVAIAAFLSASLSDLWGPRKVMLIGAGIWVAFELFFLLVALNSSNVVLVFIAYGLRGFGYPFFAYGFLVWISATANAKRLAVAIGWFYVAFSAGLPTLGALTATASLEIFGLNYYQTLWISLALVVLGAAVALLGVKEKTGRAPLVDNPEQVWKTMSFGLRLLVSDRKALMVMLTRTINSVPTYGMAVFFPALFVDRFGWSVGQFLILTTVIYAVNIPFNLFFGALGDKLGWSKTVVWFGAVLCALSMAGLYLVPAWAVDNGIEHAYLLALLIGAVFGIGLAGFVPLSAIAVSLAPEHPGAAMASYNLGIGAAVFAGPLLVALLYTTLGAAGMVYLFAALYLVAALMSHLLRGTQPGFNGVPTPAPQRVA
ncbi:MFS transporter [Arthrobacter sp. MYb224]|uniref:MFS transporter n=1 Tax=unclassified Arthrobacter TaxID=235627 RepID=UPI000CFCA4A2|nr:MULTISPECIES: MFS transporter [unclassified Arthrobacter]PQZ98882.1 MFS transporter [Arthrobacter sp. MYb224]PRA03220.1 MFS transporter [Arthrobacter sp. MYb229]PRB49690.1 MFS transporter [Arthrobacter sp. MYb216]